MKRSGDNLKLAVGHDNADAMIVIHKIHRGLWQYRKWGYSVVWHSAENKVLNGDRRLVNLDRPWGEVVIPVMCRSAYNHMRTTYCAGNDALVTVRFWETISDSWQNYNARIVMTDLEKDQIKEDDVYEVKIEFRDMIQI